MLKLLFSTLIFSQMASASLMPNIAGVDAIYGKDDRIFVDKNSNYKTLEFSKSIALIVSKDDIQKKIFFSQIKASTLNDPDGANLCSSQKFAKHHTINSCTGFLIGFYTHYHSNIFNITIRLNNLIYINNV